MNDEALVRGGPVVSLFGGPLYDVPFLVVTEADRRITFVMLESDYPAFAAGRFPPVPAASSSPARPEASGAAPIVGEGGLKNRKGL